MPLWCNKLAAVSLRTILGVVLRVSGELSRLGSCYRFMPVTGELVVYVRSRGRGLTDHS